MASEEMLFENVDDGQTEDRCLHILLAHHGELKKCMDGQRMDAKVWVYYTLTWRACGSGELMSLKST